MPKWHHSTNPEPAHVIRMKEFITTPSAMLPTPFILVSCYLFSFFRLDHFGWTLQLKFSTGWDRQFLANSLSHHQRTSCSVIPFWAPVALLCTEYMVNAKLVYKCCWNKLNGYDEYMVNTKLANKCCWNKLINYLVVLNFCWRVFFKFRVIIFIVDIITHPDELFASVWTS